MISAAYYTVVEVRFTCISFDINNNFDSYFKSQEEATKGSQKYGKLCGGDKIEGKTI